jgi:hypothetical protein
LRRRRRSRRGAPGGQTELQAQRLAERRVERQRFGQRQLVAGGGARQLEIEEAADETGERDRDHRPERDRHQALHLEGGVQDDEQRPDDAEEDVGVEPDREMTGAAQEPDALAQRVAEHGDHHRRAGDAEDEAARAAGFQRPVQLVVRAVDERGRVVGAARPPEPPDHRQRHEIRHPQHRSPHLVDRTPRPHGSPKCADSTLIDPCPRMSRCTSRAMKTSLVTSA